MNNPNTIVYDVAIIGAGPAGISAAIYAKRAGCTVALFDEMMPGGQVATTFEVENYPGFSHISGMDLAMKFAEHAASCEIEISYAAITRADLEGKIKTLYISEGKNERILQAKAVIFATGAKRRKLNVPGEDPFTGRGVSYCAACDGNFFKGKTVAVVGGGNTALEDAVNLSKLCEKVYLIHRRSEFRASKVLQDRVLAAENITFIPNVKVKEICGTTKVESMRLQPIHNDGEAADMVIAVDGVFVAVGTEPRTELLSSLNGKIRFSEDGGVETDELCRTDLDGVYVAGDARAKELRQIVTAAADGASAGWAASMYADTVDVN